MEFSVRAVAGISNCYVSLPLSLIQILLQSSQTHNLPHHLIPLQLRSLSSTFHVAWSGSASSSPHIEIAQEFLACLGLEDGTRVQFRAVDINNVPKATLVTIEPLTEDDWEVLELNADAAQDAILSQIRVVHQGMNFPLWLSHGWNSKKVISFRVVSVVPSNASSSSSVVQLVPGSEVAVAPKRRRKSSDMKSSGGVPRPVRKALLRVQDPKKMLIQESNFKGLDLGIEISSVVLIHPETAQNLLFESLQVVVIVPRLPPKMKTESSVNNNIVRKSLGSSGEELDGKQASGEKDSHYAVVRLLFSESVAKGHLMICQSLRRYLRVSIHSWLHMQEYGDDLKKELPPFILSPAQFVVFQNGKDPQNKGTEVVGDNNDLEGMLSLPQHLREELVSVPADESVDTAVKGASIHANSKKLQGFLDAWISAQLQVITSISGVRANSLVLGPTTPLAFLLVVSECGRDVKQLTSPLNGPGNTQMTKETVKEIASVLSVSGESVIGQKYSAFELTVGEVGTTGVHGGRNLFYENLNLGSLKSYRTCKEHMFNHTSTSTFSLTWMGSAVSDVLNRLHLLLSIAHGLSFSNLNLPLPGHVLICGPPGSGKSLLATAAAKSLEDNKDILAHAVFVSCSALAVEKVTSIRQMLCDYVSEALDNAPSLVVLDDLDSLIMPSANIEGSQPSASVVALTEFVISIMDECGEKRKTSCGLGPIAFVACVRALDNIPQSLRASGRFDFHVQLPAPSTSERLAILQHEIQKRSLHCPDDILLDVASKCDGYDAYDLGILVDRSILAAISRFLPSQGALEEKVPSLIADDFNQAREDFLPVSMRDITKSASEGGLVGWEDVGGLMDVQNAIKEMIELPSKFPNIFAKSPLRLRSNVLLYGPPGCGKTHIVGAVAAASSLRFISIKGPELLNKYIGASEQAVRDVFTKAAAASPCLLFFDEFDSIAPKRGHDNTGVTDRVVNQFLTELDGVEVLTGVFVFAATSRPDLLDAALLRPGRLDRLLFCDFPALHDRLDILRVLSRKLPLADDVNLDAIAYVTEGFSGADLQALLSDAQLAAVQELLDSGYDGKPGKSPLITDDLLKSVASKAKPSVSESEKQRLFAIYNQFLDSKRSLAAQSRDAKGKRATLA